MTTSVVVLPGPITGQYLPPGSASAALVVAADAGLELATALGLRPHVVVGDLDSVAMHALQRAIDQGIEIERHPADKDQTDFELAMQRAVAADPDQVIVLGGGGGRLDHLLGNLAVLSGRRAHGAVVEAWFGSTLAVPVVGSWQRSFAEGSVLSIIPWGGPVAVTAAGLRWPLRDEVLHPHHTRGISNETTGPLTRIDVASGLAWIIAADAVETGAFNS